MYVQNYTINFKITFNISFMFEMKDCQIIIFHVLMFFTALSRLPMMKLEIQLIQL